MFLLIVIASFHFRPRHKSMSVFSLFSLRYNDKKTPPTINVFPSNFQIAVYKSVSKRVGHTNYIRR